MDTVLGLSVTSTSVGWVLAEGHDADGTIVDHREMPLEPGGGVRAVSTAQQVTEEVMRVEAMAAENDQRVRIIGVTWTDDATAQAALLMEALTDAGFDNIVPIRLLDAVETLARAIALVIGFEQTAVCIVEHTFATVVMVHMHNGATQTAVKHVSGGFEGLTSWLTGMFERNGWRPGGVVVAGADSDINDFSWELDQALPVPVFAQNMVQVTVARGAALTAAQTTDFTDEQLVVGAPEPAPVPPRPRQLSYAGAVAALAAGAVTFVASLSLAVGIEIAPKGDATPAKHAAHAPAPQVARAVAPAVAPPREVAPSAPEPAAPVVAEPTRPRAPEDRPPPPDARQPYLARVLEHIPGDAGGSAPGAAEQP
ncbi:DUF7159 family protein [Mycobacterium sp. THU-M104]|uniref:DUF7159 family protein n=1 Tax=Mycobacterium sp. THU-M104 TaxID=3410515 RepID=UPI003B9ABF1B